MIESLKNLKKESGLLLEVIKNCNIEDFYLTENNQRLYINNPTALKILLKNSHHIYYEEAKGLVLVWKSFGGDKTRHYVKLIADDHSTAKNLLTILLWNYEKDLYVKLKKDSKLISAFKEKGFKFVGGRGLEILMLKQKYERPSIFKKEIIRTEKISQEV